MNKPVFLGLSILELSKKVMYKYWHDYMKPKYNEKAKLLFGHRQLYSLHKNKIYLRRHCKGCQNKFDTSNYGLDRPLEKIKK